MPGEDRAMDPKRVSDTWERGNPYERYVGAMEPPGRPRFLAWLAVPAGRRWVDVGCGTGALCAAILDHGSPSSVAGVEPSEGFLATARGKPRRPGNAPRGKRNRDPAGRRVGRRDRLGPRPQLRDRPGRRPSPRWRGSRAAPARSRPTSGITAGGWSSCGTSGMRRSSSTRMRRSSTKGRAFRCAGRKRSKRFSGAGDFDGVEIDADRRAHALRELRGILAAVPGRPGAGAGLCHVARRG